MSYDHLETDIKAKPLCETIDPIVIDTSAITQIIDQIGKNVILR